jgi:hypothetical protein
MCIHLYPFFSRPNCDKQRERQDRQGSSGIVRNFGLLDRLEVTLRSILRIV